MPQTLLLADDSLTIQRVIELTFAGEDITVVAVSDGDQAIARLDTMPPDIVLADVGMPGRNGYDVAQHVKQSPDLAHIPVILLTGAFEPVDQAKATAVGCDAVLAKPFEPQIVIGRVRELLSRPPQAPAMAAVAAAPEPVTAPEPVSAPEPVAALDAPQAVEAAPPASPAAPEPAREQLVEDYFNRLDAAFANLANTPAPPVAAVEPEQPEQPDLPITPDHFERVASIEPLEPLELFAPLEPVVPSRIVEVPSASRALPSVRDAFAAILSAEQGGVSVRPEWPPASQPAAPPPPPEAVITDDLIDRVAKRVVEQLSDRVVRETVAQIASDVAERLVREEIERIKAAINESGN